MKRNKVLVTGASGFIGSAVHSSLVARGRNVCVATRSPISGSTRRASPGLDADADWSAWVEGCDSIVHAAARVHVMHETAVDPLAEFRRTNVHGTLKLAQDAVRAGVRRFVFISSIKVNGEATTPGRAFKPEDPPAPIDAYGISKSEAERALMELGASTGLEVVVVRPPLVYGPGVKANFLALMRWLKRGIPLPLGAIDNRRTLVALDNLVDLLVTCIDHPAASNRVFLVGDGEDLSTPQLLRRLAAALGVPARLVPVPVSWLEAAAALLGKRAMAQRLCGNLQVDISKARQLLGWTPPVSVDEGLRQTAVHFLHSS
ncbi:MAG: SDR family oxidoreductase [Burkholderiaceae bacterium]|jgi:UDP-glucose 4-epimerase|nr:SDR family oxidoreductase [Burkholderiaceae bacterium]